MGNCNHLNEDGSSSIIFDNKKWTGVYPKRVKGFCTKCKKTITLTESEYRELLKEGEKL